MGAGLASVAGVALVVGLVGCGRSPATRFDASTSDGASIPEDASVTNDVLVSGDASASDGAPGGDGGWEDAPSPPTFSVGGEVEGLSGTVVLQNNGADDLSLSANGPFVFATELADETAYQVTVLSQPSGQYCAMSDGVGVVSGAPVTDVEVLCEDVIAGPEPLYPESGADWNDYVENDGTGPLDASDTACDAESDGPDYFACLHAGEIRAVSVPGRSDCARLSATDDLGAFTWVCDPSTDPVRMVSTGLRDDKHLSDLLDFEAGAWRENVVRISDGPSLIERTAPSVWWSNPVEANPTDEVLTGEGTIYVLTESDHHHELRGDRAAFVVQPGVVLSSSAPDSAPLAAFADFLWIEGAVDASDQEGMFVLGSRFSVMRGIRVRGSGDIGLYLDLLRKSVVSGADTDVDAPMAIYFRRLEHVVIRDVLVDCRQHPDSGGIVTLPGAESTGIVLDRILVWECGVDLWWLDRASISNVTVVGGLMQLQDVTNSHIWNLRVPLVDVVQEQVWGNNTAWNWMGGVRGQWLDRSRFSTLVGRMDPWGAVEIVVLNATNMRVGMDAQSYDLALVNSAVPYLRLREMIRPTAEDLVAVADSGTAVTLTDVENGQFAGLLKVGGTGTECSVTGGIDPGLVDTAVGGTNCGLQGASTATIVPGTSIADSFVGKVMTDDAANASDVDGAAAYEDIEDWTSFENEFRVWGTETSADWSCGPGQTCRIWDWSLRATDTVLRDVHPTPDGNDAIRRVWPLWESPGGCGWKFTGQVWDEAAGECVSVFLRHAVERMLDGIGNENLLCESGETCIYSPNIGAYQGHGNLIPHATIGTGGAVENVTLLRYEFNGR